jgi:hypothetical protein
MADKTVLDGYEGMTYGFDTKWLEVVVKEIWDMNIPDFLQEYTWDDTNTIVDLATREGLTFTF